MIRKYGLARLVCALAILLALVGCRPGGAAATANPPAPDRTAAVGETVQLQAQDVTAVLDARQRAVNQQDQALYLSTVLPSDAVLLKEEANLIRAAGSLDIDDFKITADRIEAADGGYTARLTQSYTLGGERHGCTYTAAFRAEGGRLYYCGPDFELVQSSHVKVWYIGRGGDLAGQLLNEEDAVLTQMQSRLGFAPQGFISIKLFDDQQVFLESVKLDLPGWVGGWHEFGESIKSFTGAYGPDGSVYKSMLNHETTHRMVSELSNDNAAYWLQEGLAGAFQNWLDAPGDTFLTGDEAGQDFTPYVQQKTIDLEKIDGGEVTKYYASSKAYAAFLLERYGWDKMRGALEYMKKFDLIPVTGAEKIDETNERTGEAIAAIYGFKTDGDFQAAFDNWLDEKRSKS